MRRAFVINVGYINTYVLATRLGKWALERHSNGVKEENCTGLIPDCTTSDAKFCGT